MDSIKQVPTIKQSEDLLAIKLRGAYSGFSDDVAAHIIAEHESKKRAALCEYYRSKARAVGLRFETYCERFGIRGMV